MSLEGGTKAYGAVLLLSEPYYVMLSLRAKEKVEENNFRVVPDARKNRIATRQKSILRPKIGQIHVFRPKL